MKSNSTRRVEEPHTFGDTASLAGLQATTRQADTRGSGTRVFLYARSGDQETFSV